MRFSKAPRCVHYRLCWTRSLHYSCLIYFQMEQYLWLESLFTPSWCDLYLKKELSFPSDGERAVNSSWQLKKSVQFLTMQFHMAKFASTHWNCSGWCNFRCFFLCQEGGFQWRATAVTTRCHPSILGACWAQTALLSIYLSQGWSRLGLKYGFEWICLKRIPHSLNK